MMRISEVGFSLMHKRASDLPSAREGRDRAKTDYFQAACSLHCGLRPVRVYDLLADQFLVFLGGSVIGCGASEIQIGFFACTSSSGWSLLSNRSTRLLESRGRGALRVQFRPFQSQIPCRLSSFQSQEGAASITDCLDGSQCF